MKEQLFCDCIHLGKDWFATWTHSCNVSTHKWAHSHWIQLSLLHTTWKTIASTYRVQVSILYAQVFMCNGTQMRLSRPPGVHSFSVSPSHFPTEFLSPFPAGYWLHSPPILMHSFHLATPCRPLPSASCCQSISMAVWLTDLELDAHFSQWRRRVWVRYAAMAGLAWCWNGWIQCDTHTRTHTAMDHLAAQSIWAVTTVVMYHLCPHCLAFCFEYVDRCIILAFDKFPYIQGADVRVCLRQVLGLTQENIS